MWELCVYVRQGNKTVCECFQFDNQPDAIEASNLVMKSKNVAKVQVYTEKTKNLYR